MRLSEPPAPPAPPALQLPLPDGRAAAVRVDERAGGPGDDGESQSVAVTYDSLRLGPIEFRLTLSEAGLSASVRAAAGAAHALAEERADVLREALAEATGRTATVEVSARRDPLDVYA